MKIFGKKDLLGSFRALQKAIEKNDFEVFKKIINEGKVDPSQFQNDLVRQASREGHAKMVNSYKTKTAIHRVIAQQHVRSPIETANVS